jgi:SAM-dependent methyltransferase
MRPSFRFSGSGPGARTRDGCSVELYREMPYFGELEPLRPLLPERAALLELGCGAGRLTRVLLAMGLEVTAVDNAPGMLAALPPGAAPVLADIESLALARRFDVALLASGLVNHPEPATRQAFLAAARRHLRPGGRLFVQRQDAAWLLGAPAGTTSTVGPLTIRVEAVRRTPPHVAMTVRYEAGGRTWRHAFVVAALADAQLEEELATAGFAQAEWIDARRRWVSTMVPTSRGAARFPLG